MIQLTAKQVEWLTINQPDTEFLVINRKDSQDVQLQKKFTTWDVLIFVGFPFDYYLTPDTYNSLPIEFKRLEE